MMLRIRGTYERYFRTLENSRNLNPISNAFVIQNDLKERNCNLEPLAPHYALSCTMTPIRNHVLVLHQG